MRTLDDLSRDLYRLDGNPYGAYRDLTGTAYDLGEGCVFVLDRAQTDPYAPASLAHLEIPHSVSGLSLPEDRPGLVGAEDFLTRALVRAAARERDLSFGRPGQEILERTTVRLGAESTTVRLTVQLPARGRRILGRAAAGTLTGALPEIVDAALRPVAADELDAWVAHCRDVAFLRRWLAEKDLVAFVGDGAVLPRRSGDSDEPLSAAVPFSAPSTLRREVSLPSGRRLSGMGVPAGVTVIVGGGYHGKSTLLRAVQRGVYPHIPGDGREWVVTRADAVSVRAEDGRAVTGVDISPFISGLPSGQDTVSFSTANASGSTSQAANLVEALEAGATALLIDEDTSATNFMLRDAPMRALISPDKEPITPFVERVRALYELLGVSTVLVAGGSGAFFGVADHVIALDSYRVSDVTERAHELAGEGVGAGVYAATDQVFGAHAAAPDRSPVLNVAAKPSRGKGGRGKGGRGGRGHGGRKPAGAKGRTTIRLGKDSVDLGPAEQLVNPAQTTGIAHVIDKLEPLLDGTRTLAEAVDEVEATMDRDGLDTVAPYRGHPGLFARPRRHEIMAAVNRFRGLR
ncbi:ABC-ATPase domain-containing protein [Corynebacterium frankenforstense]